MGIGLGFALKGLREGMEDAERRDDREANRQWRDETRQRQRNDWGYQDAERAHKGERRSAIEDREDTQWQQSQDDRAHQIERRDITEARQDELYPYQRDKAKRDDELGRIEADIKRREHALYVKYAGAKDENMRQQFANEAAKLTQEAAGTAYKLFKHGDGQAAARLINATAANGITNAADMVERGGKIMVVDAQGQPVIEPKSGQPLVFDPAKMEAAFGAPHKWKTVTQKDEYGNDVGVGMYDEGVGPSSYRDLKAGGVPGAAGAAGDPDRDGDPGSGDNDRDGDGAQVHQQMPDASQYSGRTIRDQDTGQRYKSDGKQWVPLAPAAPAARGAQEPGMVEAGNIDLGNRPHVRNPDGSISTVRSITIGIGGGKAVLIPTVIGNRVVSNDEAIRHFRQTGEHLGIFNSEQAANTYAEKLHEQQAKTLTPAETGAGVPMPQLPQPPQFDNTPNGESARKSYYKAVDGAAERSLSAISRGKRMDPEVVKLALHSRSISNAERSRLMDYLSSLSG